MTRRISVGRSASGEGASPSRSSRAKTKLSMAFRGQLASRASGGRGRVRRARTRRGDERPVPLPLGSLLYPAANQPDLALGELAVSLIGGRHAANRIVAGDAFDERAFLRLSRHDGEVSAEVLGRALLRIEPQGRLAVVDVRAVTREAFVGEDRPHVAVELGGRRGIGSGKFSGEERREYEGGNGDTSHACGNGRIHFTSFTPARS